MQSQMWNETMGFVVTDGTGENCTQLGIDRFPSLLSEMRYDYLALAIVLSLYLFTAVAVLCDDYFLPAIEMLGIACNLLPGPLYTTLAALVTSSPEFFVHVTSTFVAKGDIGTGTILGSTVFNIFAIIGLCAVVEHKSFSVQWWDVSRELFMYSIGIGALVFMVQDGRVYWFESLTLCCLFIVYIVVLLIDSKTQKHTKSGDYESDEDYEERSCCKCFEPIIIVPRFYKRSTVDLSHYSENVYNFLHWPEGKCHRIYWILSWPWNLVFTLTVPDCKRDCARKCYVLTIIMSTIWMAALAYLLTWAAAMLAYNLFIPESVVGLTYVAIGTSIPEAIGCIMFARKGFVSIAVCNAISSNTVDVLLCLGIPWMLKALIMPCEGCEHYTVINSNGLPRITFTLIVAVVVLYVSLMLAHFHLNYKIAFVCLFTYFAFVAFCCALEMNVFYDLNPPRCPHD